MKSSGRILIALTLLLSAAAIGHSLAGSNEAAGDGQDGYSQYRLDITVGGETVGWTVREGPDLTVIEPPGPDQQTRLTGFEPVYTGSHLDHQSHRIDHRLDALVPVFQEPDAELPLAYTDARDREHRLRDIQVRVYPTDETREIDGHLAHGYSLAVLTDLSSRRDDQWHDSTALRYGTVWIWPDRPFSALPFQINRHALVAFASELPAGSAGILQERLIEAFASTGMIAATETANYQLTTQHRAAFDDGADDPMRENEGFARNLGFPVALTVADFTTDAAAFDGSEIKQMARLDASDATFLGTALTTNARVGLCQRLDSDDLVGLTQLLAEGPPFEGSMTGPVEGAARGQAIAGFEDDEFFGRGFLIAVEAFDDEVDSVACIAMLRVGDGRPDQPTRLNVVADDSLDASEDSPAAGDMVAHVVVAEVDPDGMVHLRSAGMAERGEIDLTFIDDDQARGTVELYGRLLSRDGQHTQVFSLEGEFSAEMLLDRVPTRR